MAGEKVEPNQLTEKPMESISILLVDDDAICLNIVAAILKSWKYEVVTIKHPIEALCTLRVRGGAFDLVITDVHMPDMNGFELQKKIEEEFNLPVVFMSVDDQESVILRGLQSGGAFFLVKPISPNDLKNLWQYAVAKKKPKSAVIEEIGSTQESSKADKQDINELNHSPSENDKGSDDTVESETSLRNEDLKSTKDSKKKSPANVEEGEDDDDDDSGKPKKTKVVWTNALHHKFLEAVRSTGIERAVPKKILELMNVPGLKRENIASHLQKYRVFLKRVAEAAEANFKIQSPSDRNKVERTFRSKYAMAQPDLLHKKPHFRHLQNLNRGELVKSLQPNLPFTSKKYASSAPNSTPLFGFSQSRPLLNQTNSKQPLIGNPKPLYQQAIPSAHSTPPFGSGQSSPLLNQTNSKQPLIGNAKPLYQQANPYAFRMEPYDKPTGSLLNGNGNIFGGIMNGTAFMQPYQQKDQVTPEIPPKIFSFPLSNEPAGCSYGTNFMQLYQQKDQVTPESCTNAPITGYGNVEDFANSNLNPRPNYQNNSSYVGLQIASDGLLVGLPANLNLNCGLINGAYLGQGEPFVGFQNGSNVPPTFDNAGQGEPFVGFQNGNNIPPTVDNAEQGEPFVGFQNDNDTLLMPRSPVLSGNSGHYFGQEVPSSGFLSGSYVLPTFNNAIQVENTSVMPLSPAKLQANAIGNEGGSDHIFGLLDNEFSNVVFGVEDSNPNFLQPYGESGFNIPNNMNIIQPYGEGSFNIPDDVNIIQPYGEGSFNLPDDINILQSYGEGSFNIPDDINIIQPYCEGSFNTQHDVGALNSAFSFSPDDHVKNNQIVLNNDQSLEKPSGGEMIFSNVNIDGADESFRAFDQTFDMFPSQLVDQEFLDRLFDDGDDMQGRLG